MERNYENEKEEKRISFFLLRGRMVKKGMFNAKQRLLGAGVHLDVGPRCPFCGLFRSLFVVVLEELAIGISASALEVFASGFSVILVFFFGANSS